MILIAEYLSVPDLSQRARISPEACTVGDSQSSGSTSTWANRHDSVMMAATLDAIPPLRIGRRGRPRRRPDKLHADQAYDAKARRQECRVRGIMPHIARKGIESSQKLGRQPFRQGERAALDEPDVAHAGPMGGMRLGAAVPDRAGPVRTRLREQGRRHKPLLDVGRQLALQARRWLPGRDLVLVGDGGFSALLFLDAMRLGRITAITRLRLDAALYDPASPRPPGTIGRLRTKGARLPTLAATLEPRPFM